MIDDTNDAMAAVAKHLETGVRSIDSSVVAVTVTGRSVHGDFNAAEVISALGEAPLRLSAAMAAAAKAGQDAGRVGLISGQASERLDVHKARVDDAATTAGERFLEPTASGIVVRAGEGARDESPGARLDQVFGKDDGGVHAVIDYIDGTGLVARGLPNALSLGALASNVRRTPDLKVFAVLAPRAVLSELNRWDNPKELAVQVLRGVARLQGCSTRDLSVLTHSRDVGRPQDPWYSHLGEVAGKVIVPDPISVEPPYILSKYIHKAQRIDCMVGVMGLVELVYAAILLDLTASDDAFGFRLVSRSSAKDLLQQEVNAFELTDRDRAWAKNAGLGEREIYLSDDFVEPHSAQFAAMFAVTENTVLDLQAATPTSAQGLLVLRGGSLLNIDIRYGASSPQAIL